MMAEITNHEELEAWLKDKPQEWVQIVAVRAALRVLPIALIAELPTSADISADRLRLLAIRSIFIAWASGNQPTAAMVKASKIAAREGIGYTTWDVNRSIAADAARSAAHAVNIVVSADTKATAAHTADAAARAAEGDDDYSSLRYPEREYAADASYTKTRVFWNAVDSDCIWLESLDHKSQTQARLLAHRALWLDEAPEFFVNAWNSAKNRLQNSEIEWVIWIEWFTRRIHGRVTAWSLSRKTDLAIQLRIAEQPDKFWKQGAAVVNARIKSWIDEAKSKRANETQPHETKLPGQYKAPAEQSPYGIRIRQSDSGKIEIDREASNPELLRDGDSRDRHAEALAEAQRLLDLAHNSNSAQRLIAPLERYLQAAGESIDTLSPSLIVQRGERLRQYLHDYEADAPDPDLVPLPSEILGGLKGWRSAHNLVVGLDPKLRQMDAALLGPDVKPTLIAPDEMRWMIADADKAGLLEEGVREILDETADLAPAIPDPANRQSVWSGETAANFAIELVTIMCRHPGKSFVAAVALTKVTAASGLGLTIALAVFAKKREVTLLNLLENYPACQAILREILAKILPEDK